MVQLARADAAGSSIRKKEVHLGELVLQVYELFQLKFEAKGIEVTTDLSATGPLMVDTEMISQVISNLLDNACQYTPPGGRLRIKAENLPGRIKLSLTNSGEAISPAELPFVFERFYRGEKSRAGDHGGAGLG